MKPIERRAFLKAAGAGTAAVVVAAAGGSVVELIMSGGERRIHFTATAGLPREPLPAYASYVIKGQIDLRARTGMVTTDLFAGAPSATSNLIFPGMSRTISVTSVREGADGTIDVVGRAESPSELQPGEDPQIRLVLDRPNRLAEASFFGQPVVMQLVERAQ